MDDEDNGDINLPRWIEMPAGILLFLFTLLCFAGSVAVVARPSEKNPALAVVIGVIMIFGCVWIFEKSLRLIFNKPVGGGLMTTKALRGFAYMFLLMPVGGLFTGYFKEKPFIALLQTAANVSFFFGLRAIALEREQKARENP